MISQSVRFILFFALISLATAACDITINSTQTSKPGEFEFVFQKNTTKNICFNLFKPQAQQTKYCLRLDYRFCQCLDGSYDQYLHFNGESYYAEVPIKRKCKKLDLSENQEQSVRFAYEFSEGYDISFLVGFKHLIDTYLPTIAFLIVFSIIWQNYVFGEENLPRKKQ